MTIVIAEAGVNHNGCKKTAFKLIDEAYKAGANIVKFQTFKAQNLVTNNARQADYQILNTNFVETQQEMLKKLELSFEDYFDLYKYCNELGIEFLSTAFDSESLQFLVEEIGLKKLKIPSGEITNAPLVLEHARSGCDLIVSTGLSNLTEVESVLGVIAFGLIAPKNCKPNETSFSEAYASEKGQIALKNKVTLLHCTTDYPAHPKDINLKAIETLSNAFKLPVGFSDHSGGISISLASISYGVSVIEKHFTLDKDMNGPDHKASLDPIELKAMIEGIRDIELAMGDGIKKPTISELKNKNIVRKSLVAEEHIELGTIFTDKNISIKRPGSGISPHKYWEVLGKNSTKKYLPGDLIDE